MIDTNGALWEMDVQTFQKSFGMPPDKVVYPLKMRVQVVKGKIVCIKMLKLVLFNIL